MDVIEPAFVQWFGNNSLWTNLRTGLKYAKIVTQVLHGKPVVLPGKKN